MTAQKNHHQKNSKGNLTHVLMGINKHKGTTKGMQYFNSLDWEKMWIEFLTSRDKHGGFTYPTSFSFAKEKGQSEFNISVIYRAIGPPARKLKSDTTTKRQVPYLGDWQVIRAKAFFYEEDCLNNLKKVTADKLDALEAGRSASTVVVEMMDRWLAYDRRIDEVFQYSPVVAELGDTQAQEKRAMRLFKLKRTTTREIGKLIDKFLHCHGVSTDGLNDLGQLAMVVSNSAARNALAGVATGASLVNPESGALNMLSKAIFEKAQIFKMPLPAAVVDDEKH